MYDSDIGRWWVHDPKASDYYPTSPYAYCANDPMNFVDPNGEDVYYYNITTREKIWVADTGGAQFHFVHFVQPGPEGGFQEIGCGSITGEDVYIGETRDGWAMSNINYWENLSLNRSDLPSLSKLKSRYAVYKAQNDFLTTIPDVAAFIASKGADFITALGIVTAPVGGSPLIALGGTMSVLGNSYYGIQNIMDGDTATGVYRIGTSLFFYYLPFSLNKYMTEGQQAIFNGYLLPHSIIIGKTAE